MPLRCETLKKFSKKSDPANFFAPLLFSKQKQLTKEIVLLRKRSITIGLLITFLISLTTSELLAWHMIRKGDQSTVTFYKSCKRVQDNNDDSHQGFFFRPAGDQSDNLRLQLTKFCTFAEPQMQIPYCTLLTPTPFHYTIYTPHREDVCIDDVGRPPKA
jgi:hypothetical protein